MTRRQAIVSGMLYGGLIGPALAGLALGTYELIGTGVSSYSDLTYPFLSAFVTIIFAGIPGFAAGAVGGFCCRKLEARIFFRAICGALLGAAAMLFICLVMDLPADRTFSGWALLVGTATCVGAIGGIALPFLAARTVSRSSP